MSAKRPDRGTGARGLCLEPSAATRASRARHRPREDPSRRDDARHATPVLRTLIDYAETQQRVFDHDAVLVLESVGEAVAYLGQFDDALRDRYGATLAVLDARRAEIADGLAQSRAAEAKSPSADPTPIPASPLTRRAIVAR